MINELRTKNNECLTAYFCFLTDVKTHPLLFTDKQAFQEMKTTGGVATQFKRTDNFTIRPVYSWWINCCWSLDMRLDFLGTVSREIMIVQGFELPERNAAHTGLSRWSSGFEFSPAALRHFEYFCFPLSLPFNKYSIPVNSLTTDAVLLRTWQRRANKDCDILGY